MEEKNVPYFIHEGIVARDERIIKRLVITLIITIILLFTSNMVWLYYWNQYDYVDTEIELVSDDGGNANFIGNNGDIRNGADQSQATN